MAIRLQGLTYEDLRQMPEDGNRYEVIGGELIVSPSPATPHQLVVGELFYAFYGFAKASGLGSVFVAPYDVELADGNVIEPDIVYVSRERLGIVDRTHIVGVPDLLVEVVSPSSRGRDEIQKARLYAEAGVREEWLVDPERRSVLVYRLVAGRYEALPTSDGRARSLVLPGFAVEVAALFAVLD